MQYFFDAYKNFFKFSTRADRKQFWGFAVLWLIFFFMLHSLLFRTVFAFDITSDSFFSKVSWFINIANFIVLLSALPVISLSIRRMHDINLRGWWTLIVLIPVISAPEVLPQIFTTALYALNKIGIAAFIILALLPGTKGDNRFGPAPVEEKGFLIANIILFTVLIILTAVVLIGSLSFKTSSSVSTSADNQPSPEEISKNYIQTIIEAKDNPAVYKETCQKLTEAAAQNNSFAQYDLASIYFMGDFCELNKDTDKALYWLVTSYNNKNPNALELLIDVTKYILREDRKMSVPDAVFDKPDNQYDLYLLTKDIPYLGAFWLKRAAENGRSEAKQILANLEEANKTPAAQEPPPAAADANASNPS